MSTLSMDARIVAKTYFGFGEKTTVRIGGEGAQSIMSERGSAAMQELINGGYVSATEFNRYGRMEYRGTEKLNGLPRLSMKDIEAHGKWSFTMPNPALKGQQHDK